METIFNKVNPDQETDNPKKCWCMWNWLGMIALTIAVIVTTQICSYILRPQPTGLEHGEPGTYYTVYLRRDTMDSSAPASVGGWLVAVNREAIHLVATDHISKTYNRPQETHLWIPKSSILSIEYKVPLKYGALTVSDSIIENRETIKP